MSTLPRVQAFFLPDDCTSLVAEWTTLEIGHPDNPVRLELPRVTPALIGGLTRRLVKSHQDILARRPVEQIARVVDRAVSRWLDPYSRYRYLAESLIPLTSGYTESMIRKGLAGYLAQFRYTNLMRLLEDELGDPAYLDAFRPRLSTSGLSRAFGPQLVAHIWSGNVPGLAAQSLVSALLAKAASIGKVASEEPIFPALFAQSIAEVDPEIGACLAVLWWPGGDAAIESVLFDSADAVIAYGGESAIAGVRSRVPARARFIPYGHKLSFGVVCREALAGERARETALRAAYDASKFDQQGCLSPHLFYVERGGDLSPKEFARLLSEAMESQAQQIPRGRVSPEESARIREERSAVEFRELAGEPVALHASQAGTGWTVAYDEDPSFTASCLNRFVWVKPVEHAARIPQLLDPVRQYLQTSGVASNPDRLEELAEILGRVGLDRVCPIGQMPDPAVGWHHDGRFNIIDLLRWTDLETANSAGRWEFEHPTQGVFGLGVEAAPNSPAQHSPTNQ